VRVHERAKEGGGTLPRPAHASLEDVLWCLEHDITRRAVYIPRMRNVHVDSLSRERERERPEEGPLEYRVDRREWSLEPEE
jgi:hypothetical protein